MDKEELVYICNGVLLNHKKNKIMPFTATWMDIDIIILGEVCQKRKTDIQYHLYVESKIQHKKLNFETEIDSQEQTCGCQKGRRLRDGLGVWV